LPCEPEIEKMHRETRRNVRTIQTMVFLAWILVPLLILILGVTSPLVGCMALAFGLWKIAVKGVKLFGNPDRWVPGHKEKREREAKIRHYVYHCDQNPEGFTHLCAENFSKQIEEEERSNKASEVTSDPEPSTACSTPQG